MPTLSKSDRILSFVPASLVNDLIQAVGLKDA
jgi:hypothetical protein